MRLIANARMYAVTDASRAAWESIFAWLSTHAGVPLDLLAYPPPAPLSELWRRSDLGCVMMCGWPFSRASPQPRLLAAPVPLSERYDDRAIYFSDLVVHKESPFRTLEDTFGGTVGWTLEDSHSGFNLLRYHLLRYRTEERPRLYARSVGGLINPLGALRAVANGEVDVAPVDSFCHDLFRAADHPFTKLTRTVATTAPSPMPSLIAAADVPSEIAERLSSALLSAHRDPRMMPWLEAALVKRFDRVEPDTYRYTENLAKAAAEVRYPVPG
jgi:ABC-type phosphate/phosphonate transport system substrate-binding protein